MRALLATALVLTLAACATRPFDSDGGLGPGAGDGPSGARDAAVSSNPDSAVCMRTPRDAGMCPCGTAGLCRPATGRLVVQTQSNGGNLRVVVMDDNGCNPVAVASDFALGVPKWAPDHERIAYVAAETRGVALHVLRVSGRGTIECDQQYRIRGNDQIVDLAWAAGDQVWLFSPTRAALYLWQAAQQDIVSTLMFNATRFDAVGMGPLAWSQACQGADCNSVLLTSPSVTTMNGTAIYSDAMGTIGPLRLSPDGTQVVFEELSAQSASSSGMYVVPTAGGMAQMYGEAGDRSPAFALDGQALVYTTDDGHLRYRMIAGAEAGQVLEVPSWWKNVYSPDWAPFPADCQPRAGCF